MGKKLYHPFIIHKDSSQIKSWSLQSADTAVNVKMAPQTVSGIWGFVKVLPQKGAVTIPYGSILSMAAVADLNTQLWVFPQDWIFLL